MESDPAHGQWSSGKVPLVNPHKIFWVYPLLFLPNSSRFCNLEQSSLPLQFSETLVLFGQKIYPQAERQASSPRLSSSLGLLTVQPCLSFSAWKQLLHKFCPPLQFYNGGRVQYQLFFHGWKQKSGSWLVSCVFSLIILPSLHVLFFILCGIWLIFFWQILDFSVGCSVLFCSFVCF